MKSENSGWQIWILSKVYSDVGSKKWQNKEHYSEHLLLHKNQGFSFLTFYYNNNNNNIYWHKKQT